MTLSNATTGITFVTAIIVLVNSVVGYFDRRRIKKTLKAQNVVMDATEIKTDEIHLLVNDRLSKALDRIVVLTAHLAKDLPLDLQEQIAQQKNIAEINLLNHIEPPPKTD